MIRIFDSALGPTGLSANQFEVLVYLFGCRRDGKDYVSVGALADLIGKHPTTLNRDLKPLKEQGLIVELVSPVDGRVRGLSISSKGHAKLSKAVPFWRRAQKIIQKTLGVKIHSH